MTPLPKRRWSTRRQGKKRATHMPLNLTSRKCSNCGQLKISHAVCPSCGFYRGKPILSIKNNR